MTTGFQCTHIGASGGTSANVTGNNVTTLGYAADTGSGALSFASAIGAGAIVTTSNTIQLGRSGLDSVNIGNNLFINGTTTFGGSVTLFEQNSINTTTPAGATSFLINNFAGTLTGNENLVAIGVNSATSAGKEKFYFQ